MMKKALIRQEKKALQRIYDNAITHQTLPPYVMIGHTPRGYTVFLDRYAMLADRLPPELRERMNNELFDVDIWEDLRLGFSLEPGHEREHWQLFYCMYRLLMAGKAINTEDGPFNLKVLLEDAADRFQLHAKLRKGAFRHVKHV